MVEELVALMPLINNKPQPKNHQKTNLPVQAVENDYEAA